MLQPALAPLLALLLATVAPTSASTFKYAANSTLETGLVECDALVAAGLADKLLFPGDDEYEPRVKSWWSASARLRPWCIVQPRSTEDVSAAVVAISNAEGGAFAVRSGGHSHWSGGSNIQHGVTIDLKYLNQTVYHAETKSASIGPSLRWGDVFLELEKVGRSAVGGRDGNVGIGGFMTGGGNSYFTGRYGFACDNVYSAEVVLADGSVVTASRDSHPDLFKALKGGSGNFGIVTKFEIRAFENDGVWGGIRASPYSEVDAIVEALVNFTNENHESPETAFLINFTYQPDMFDEPVIAQVLVETNGNPDPPIFKKTQEIPELLNDVKKRPMSGLANDYLLPSGVYNSWFTLTFKNDPRVVKKAAELHKTYVEDLLKIVPPKDLVTQSLFQPIPALFTEHSVEAGGNVLGLDQLEGNHLQWLSANAVKTGEFEAIVHRRASTMKTQLEEYAASIDALVPWQYVNYADPSQNPLKSYGKRNIDFLKEVSHKYDPAGVFQRMVPSGFRLYKVW